MAITKGSRVNAARLPENRKERSADGRSALFCMLAFGKREMVKEWKMEERTQERKVFEHIFKGFAGCGGEYDFLRLHTDDING